MDGRMNLAALGRVASATFAVLFILSAPARAATVFDNYTGDTTESFGTNYVGASFTPTANFDFTGEAAFVVSENGSPLQDFTLSLYSSAGGGSPDALLWTSDKLSVSDPGSFVGATYGGPAIELQDGSRYFVVLHEIGLVNWYGLGSAGAQIYVSGDGSNWSFQGPGALQFAVYGDPGSPAAPEAPAWLMMIAGLAGLGLANGKRFRARAARQDDRRSERDPGRGSLLEFAVPVKVVHPAFVQIIGRE